MEPMEALGYLPEGPVRRMFAAAGQRDIDAMVAEFAEDYVNVTPIHPERNFTGRDQVRANWSALFAGIPNLTPVITDAVTAGNGRVWVEWQAHGTRRDNVPVEMAGVAIFTVSGEKLASVRFYLEPVERASGNINTAVRATAGTVITATPRP